MYSTRTVIITYRVLSSFLSNNTRASRFEALLESGKQRKRSRSGYNPRADSGRQDSLEAASSILSSSILMPSSEDVVGASKNIKEGFCEM